MNRYLDTNCETLVWAKNISTDGCTAFNTDLWTDVDTEDKLNGLIQCTSSEDLPLHDDYELYRSVPYLCIFTVLEASFFRSCL